MYKWAMRSHPTWRSRSEDSSMIFCSRQETMDRISEERRSWNMSRIKGKDTSPEIRVRSTLHQMGYRFRLHRADLPGKPDITLTRLRLVVFVHGCYWHRHPGCKYAYTPKSKVEFWTDKFTKNVERDQRNATSLLDLGWQVAVVWECETKCKKALIKLMDDLLGQAKAGLT